MADVIEETPDIGVQYPAHFLRYDARRQSVERVVRSPPRAEPIRNTDKVLFIDLLEDGCHSLLHDLVFQCRMCPCQRFKTHLAMCFA